MKYLYEDLSDNQFEDLIILLGQELFGKGLQGFAVGPDGGRDAKFIGTAQDFPSKADLWKGTTIVQAKHTNALGGCFSDPALFSLKNKNCIVFKEVERIKTLRKNNGCDNYMLFSNRRLSASLEDKIRKHIAKECDMEEKCIYIGGLEQLENFMKIFPKVPELANLDLVDSPLIVSPEELAEVIEAFAEYHNEIEEAIAAIPTPRVPYEEKNRLNNMTQEYAKEQRKKFLRYAGQIYEFLSDPDNFKIRQLYESVVEEFQLKITAHRKDYQTFDKIMEYLRELLFNRDIILKRNKKLTRAMLFYMYWNCDLGENEKC